MRLACYDSAGAMAQVMSKDDFKAGKDKIGAEYKTAKATCDSLSGNAKDVCIKEAKAAQTTAKADDVFHAAVIDVSAEKRAEDKVCQLSLAVEQTTQSVVITDLTGNIEYANAACMAISGYSHDR